MQPVNYPITTPFGRKGSWAAGYHTGNDYACPVGTPVRATKGGKVISVTTNKDYGINVVVQSWHNKRNVRHLYAHLSHVCVVEGQRIGAGRVIALSGNTGNSTGPHLHYEERLFPYGYRDHRRPEMQDWIKKVKRVV